MKRRIVQQGPATLMVSLPAKWAKRYGLKKGQEMELVEEGPKLVLHAEGEPEQETLTLHLKDVKHFPDRMIHVPFKQGYDQVVIEFDDPKAMPEIEKKVERLLGFEIVDQKANSCTIKSFTTIEEHDFDKLLRRVFLLVLTMAQESAEELNKGNNSKLRSIGDIERTVEKFAQFNMRLLNKDVSLKSRDVTEMFATVWSLEQISDSFAIFCNLVSDDDLVLTKEEVKLYGQVVKLYEEFYRFYYRRTLEESIRLKNQMIKLRKQCYSSLNNKNAELLVQMIKIINRISELSFHLI